MKYGEFQIVSFTNAEKVRVCSREMMKILRDGNPSPAVLGECRRHRRRSAWLSHCQELKDLCVFVVRKSNKLLAQIPAEHS